MKSEINPHFNLDGNHHSVPKFYLRQWENGNNLVKVTDINQSRVSFKSPNSLTSVKNFYTATFSDGRRDSSAEQIMSHLENDASRVIKQLHEQALSWPLNDYDRGKLCAFTAYQATRVSKYRSALIALVKDRASSLELNLEPETLDENNLHIQGIAAVSDAYTLDLLKQDMGIFVSSKNLLVTSDNPVIRNVAYPDTFSPLSGAFPLRATLIPLSPRILLAFFGDERVNCDKPFDLSEEAAAHINEMQRINAEAKLYSLSEE